MASATLDHGYVRRPELISVDTIGSLVVVVALHAGRTRVHLAHAEYVDAAIDPVKAIAREAARKLAQQAQERTYRAARRRIFAGFGLTTKGAAPVVRAPAKPRTKQDRAEYMAAHRERLKQLEARRRAARQART